MSVRLESLDRCFHGIIPGVLATCDREAVPNVTYISQVHLIDERHVALSCQFFNKTRQNLDVHPLATLELYDPLTFEAYRLRLRFLRAEGEGPLFDEMAARIEAIAFHNGMAGIFKLRSSDVFEVLSIEKREGYIEEPADGSRVVRELPPGPLTELRGLQLVSERVSRACSLDALLEGALAAFDEVFGFRHGTILLFDESSQKLTTVATRGYPDAPGIGAEVAIGEGMIGTVGATRKLLRIASSSAEMRYGRAIRAEYEQTRALGAEIPLPRLADGESQMAIPLVVQDRLIGVIALECRDRLTFGQWHEPFLQVLANQIAGAIDRMTEDDAESEPSPEEEIPKSVQRPATLHFCFYRNDDCVFVDGEYLIRSVPGKILWKLLRSFEREGRTEFSNRELRLDPALGLPALRDNLESRLILLRKRLEQKCPDVQIVPTRRGRFALTVGCRLDLVERDTA
jgi:adenylate cyclase